MVSIHCIDKHIKALDTFQSDRNLTSFNHSFHLRFGFLYKICLICPPEIFSKIMTYNIHPVAELFKEHFELEMNIIRQNPDITIPFLEQLWLNEDTENESHEDGVCSLCHVELPENIESRYCFDCLWFVGHDNIDLSDTEDTDDIHVCEVCAVELLDSHSEHCFDCLMRDAITEQPVLTH